MSNRKQLVLAVLVLLALGALYVLVVAPTSEAVLDDSLNREVPPFARLGPLAVGARHLAAGAQTPLDLTVWYPAQRPGDETVDHTYRYEVSVIPGLGATAIATYRGQAMRDAPYDFSTSPYPLVILAPGFAIGRGAYGWLAEHLASHGFVIVSPAHDENLFTALSELWRSTIIRPEETLALLSYLDEQAAIGGRFDGLVDTGTVAVIGHSYGGYTALALAGARLDTDGFAARCKMAAETDDPNVWLCDALLPKVGDIAALAGLETTPNGLWPGWSDPRIDAIVPLAGDAYLFDQDGLAQIEVPVMAIGGTRDGDTPYMWGTHPTYEYVSSQRKARIALNEAEHMVFTGPCEAIPWYAKPLSGEFCSEPVWDRVRAHNLVKHFTTAFLLAELKQDREAASALRPEHVEFSDVTYDAQGF